jgi:lysophospholipase L1-like esterase
MKSRETLRMLLLVSMVLSGLLTAAQAQEGAAPDADQIEARADPFGRSWIGTWGAAPQALGNNPFSNVTLRQIIHTSGAGRFVRVRLDNSFGDQPLTFSDVHIALQDSGAAVLAQSDRIVTFGGAISVTIAQGALAFSDPVDLAVPAQSNLAITFFLPGTVGQLTGHHDSNQVSYVSTSGNHSAETTSTSFTTPIFDWYWLNAVDVLGHSAGTVVTLGDSITNGANSAFGQNRRWPDILAERLLADGNSERRSVINVGIDGAQLLTFRGDCCPTAVAGLARLDRDVLAQAGVTHAIVLLGTNDIGFSRDATSLIAGFQQLIAQLHAKGVKVIGGSVTPFAGSIIDSPDREVTRQTLNQWIRSSKSFDGVADFDQAVRDPANQARLLPTFDSGDHLHPGDAGYQAMGNSIKLSLLQ